MSCDTQEAPNGLEVVTYCCLCRMFRCRMFCISGKLSGLRTVLSCKPLCRHIVAQKLLQLTLLTQRCLSSRTFDMFLKTALSCYQYRTLEGLYGGPLLQRTADDDRKPDDLHPDVCSTEQLSSV